jgi:hypothetical protein
MCNPCPDTVPVNQTGMLCDLQAKARGFVSGIPGRWGSPGAFLLQNLELSQMEPGTPPLEADSMTEPLSIHTLDFKD